MNKAQNKDKAHVVQLLCEAFETNKSINYIVKQDVRRKERIRALMEYSFEIARRFGEVFLAEDGKACALVLYPEKKKTSLSLILLDIRLALAAIGISNLGKVLEKERKTAANHPKALFLHLWFLGVSASSQRQGIGRKLLTEIIQHAEQLKRPVYLETSMTENLQFYKKSGFEIFHEIDLSYKIYMLRRKVGG